MKKVDLTKAPSGDVTDSVSIVTPMPEPVVVPAFLTRAMGEPETTWTYRLPDGSAYGAVCRWDPEGKRKEIRPIVWNGKEHVTSGFGPDRPLYNSDLMALSPSCPVLIVEGEKTVDAAQQYVPEGWIVTTWQGGSSSVLQADWSVMAGHTCVFWPDNDDAGIGAAADAQIRLAEIGVACSIVALGEAFPEKWDLADALPEKFKPSQITALLKRELKRAAVAKIDTPPPVKAEPQDPDESVEREYRCLGYDREYYYVMSQQNFIIKQYASSALMTERGCRSIYPDAAFWGAPQGRPDGKGVNWIEAGLSVMDRCHKVGIYDPRRLRGRGVWIDKAEDSVDRVILNTGNKLMITRPSAPVKEASFVRVRSKWIYEKAENLIIDVDDYQTKATDEDGRMIRELCNRVRWDAPIYGDLLAGWIATAVVCGGLQWRTHCWVTGNQGSGKSTVVNEVAAACLGDLALYPLGATTEAGIRQAVENDAVPVVFDEAEGDDKAKMQAEARRKAVLDLMRQSSSEGRGRILKGSANHSARAFTMRSSFLMSSIGVGLKEAADLTRTAVLTIRPIESYSFQERKSKEQLFKDFLSLASEMPLDMPQRLLSRQVGNLFTLRHNIEVFKETIAVSLANRRIGDQLGTLLAGCHSLYSSQRLTPKNCETYIDRYNWDEFTSVKAEREDMALLHHIAGSMIRAETSHGAQDRSIGEILEIVVKRQEFGDIPLKIAEETLSRFGLKMERERGEIKGVWIATNVQSLNRLMQTSVYFEGWTGVLLRHPYAKKSESAVHFKGMKSRAIYMPIQEWPIDL